MVMVSAMLGRIHLSGRPDLLAPEQLALVRRAMETYKTYRSLLVGARPRWPLGLPGWRDGWIALALNTEAGGDRGDTTLLALWRREGAPETLTVPLPWTAEADQPRLVFGAGPQPAYDWNGRDRTVRVTLPAERSAVLLSFGANLGTTA